MRRANTLSICLVGALGVAGALAAPAPVDELSGGRGASAQALPASGASELFAQLQTLQEEVRQLQGRLEEQANQISQLEQQQKDNYLDLDGRLSALMAGGLAGAGAAGAVAPGGAFPPGGAGAPVPAGPGPGAGTSPVPASQVPIAADAPLVPPAAGAAPQPAPDAPLQPAGAVDQGAYDVAYELLKQGRMDEALSGFQSFAASHSNSSLVPNAVYWIGEIYLVKNDQEAALAQFSRVADGYPGHPKAADAHYKLGTLYLQRNDKAQARAHLERAVLAGGSVAALAKRYLDTHF